MGWAPFSENFFQTHLVTLNPSKLSKSGSKSWVRITPECKVFRTLSIAMLFFITYFALLLCVCICVK
jgi:hypothetical protein